MLGLSLSLIPDSFAEIEKGINYDKQVLQTFPDGSQKIKFSVVPERILHLGSYVDYVFTDNGNSLQMESAHGSILLDKTACSFSFYKKGFISGNPLFTDSIVAKMANSGTNNWGIVTQVNNASCEAYFDQGNDSLVAKRYAAGVGFIEYKYMLVGGNWKTQLEATNLSSNTNKKFGFTQTIDLNRDTINWGGLQKNLDNFNGTTFERTWLENHESKLIDLLNNFRFDVDLAFDMLESVYVLDSGENKSKLSFNYLRTNDVLLPNETMIIDPTFTDTTSSQGRVFSDTQLGTSCDTVAAGKDTTFQMTKDDSDNTERCNTAWIEFDISSAATDWTVSAVTLEYDVTSATLATACTWRETTVQPSIGAQQTLYDNGFTGTPLGASDTACTTVANGKVFTFNATGIQSVQDAIDASQSWFGIAGFYTNQARVSTGNTGTVFRSNDAILSITYSTIPPPNAITDLTLDSVSQTTATVSFTAPNLHGETLQNYSLYLQTPQTNNVLTFNQNFTNNPLTISGLTLGTAYSANATANTAGGKNFTGMVILNFTTATFNPPGAPTLGAIALSDTALRLTSVAGTAGDNATAWYGVRCELNGAGSWTTEVSNSTLPSNRQHEITGLTLGDELICQWRDGSSAGWSDWSNNATDTLALSVVASSTRTDVRGDHLLAFMQFVDSYGGIYFGLGVVPFAVMIIGFMAGKKTVRIFTLITLCLMGIIHASGYYQYPGWYWSLSILFGLGLVMGRQRSD